MEKYSVKELSDEINVAHDQKEKSIAGGCLTFHNWVRYAQNMIE